MIPFSAVKSQSFRTIIYHEISLDNFFQNPSWSPSPPVHARMLLKTIAVFACKGRQLLSDAVSENWNLFLLIFTYGN